MTERPLDDDDPIATASIDAERKHKLREANADADRERYRDVWGHYPGDEDDN